MTQTTDEVLSAGGGVNRGQRDYWEPDGPRQYQQFGDTNEALLAPAGQAMLDAADCGQANECSMWAAALALPRSKRRRGPRRPAGFFGVDISGAMLQPARQRIAAAGVDNVELNFAPYAGQQGVVMDATAGS